MLAADRGNGMKRTGIDHRASLSFSSNDDWAKRAEENSYKHCPALPLSAAMLGRVARSVLRPLWPVSVYGRAFVHSSGRPLRKGLLKYVDLAEERDGYVGGGFLTGLVRKANDSREVRELVEEGARRFNDTVPWQLLAAAAQVSRDVQSWAHLAVVSRICAFGEVI